MIDDFQNNINMWMTKNIIFILVFLLSSTLW